MKIYIGADHRGFLLKAKTIKQLKVLGHDVVDVGTYSAKPPCDYPQISLKVATQVARDPAARGILVCMTGIGHSIAANKVPGAYAALCYNKKAAILSRQHNNANILVVGAKFVSPKDIPGIVSAWLKAEFEGGRHERRVNQIREIEKKFCK